MPTDIILAVSMTLAVTAWVLIFAWYVHPVLRERSLADALRPLLLLHCFRYVGLMFLVPGVTAVPLDPRFALPAAYGDLVAAILAFSALAALQRSRATSLALAWTFNVWGLADLLNAVARGLVYAPDGALGATFWIPVFFVPPLLVSHAYIFWWLVRRSTPGRVVGDGAQASG
ncbi:MAG: hypothetical protein KDJ24_00600 [Gammaproteobacteria bacterium]|nr:hypothetical protein [Gammaproteobacteria bacterium]